MPIPDHETLLTKARAGDRAALVSLLEALGPQVRQRIAAKIPPTLRAQLDEDDVMQVTYLEAVLRLDRFTGGGATGFLAWLSRLAENNLIDAVRAMESAKRPDPSKRVSTGGGGGGGGGGNNGESTVALVELLGATTSTPSRHAAKGEAARFLEAALITLPPDYQKVVRLYDLEGKAPKDVAAEMQRSQGAVFMIRARAHERLRDALGGGGGTRFFSTPA
jgi:RNA polymerase sigma-70 factor (subfamily 1)